jgi:hypothetical protein
MQWRSYGGSCLNLFNYRISLRSDGLTGYDTVPSKVLLAP